MWFRMTAYGILKIVHLLGVILLVGNVTVTACWKFYADRSRDKRIIAFSQRLVTLTDWAFTSWGIALTVIGGYGAAWVIDLDPWRTGWVVWTEVMFVLSGMIWLFILLPIQIRQARMARGFTEDVPIPEAYFRQTRLWLAWGVVATVPLVAAITFMVMKS
jgi:uncharacterized membrane protein